MPWTQYLVPSDASALSPRVDVAEANINKLEDIATIYATEYGVKTDGTDSTTALNNAITDAGSGIVILPSGTITILGTLIIAVNGLTLKGQGKRKTILKKTTTGALIDVNKVNPSDYKKDITLQNLALDGNSTANFGIDVYSTSFVNLISCYIHHFVTAGARYEDVTVPYFQNTTFEYNLDGLILGRVSDAVNIITCDFIRNTGYGLIAGDLLSADATSRALNVIGGGFILNNIGIKVKGNRGNANISAYFERNTVSHIQVGESGGNTVSSVIVENSLLDCGSAFVTPICINTYNLDNLTVRNNTFLNATKVLKLNNALDLEWSKNTNTAGIAIELASGEQLNNVNDDVIHVGSSLAKMFRFKNMLMKLSKGDSSTRPTASADYEGCVLAYDRGTGVFDEFQVCLKKSDGTYGWFGMQPISSGITANRPTVVAYGFMYRDTQIHKTVWWEGSWLDASGNPA